MRYRHRKITCRFRVLSSALFIKKCATSPSTQSCTMSDEERPPVGAPVSYPQLAGMNYSNAAFDRISERVERSRDDPQHQAMLAQFGLPGIRKPGPSQMLAASSLACLVKPSFTGHHSEDYLPDNDPDCDFQIPLRFTKSGRRRATPFPMKVGAVMPCHTVFLLTNSHMHLFSL